MQSFSSIVSHVPMDWVVIGVFFALIVALALRLGTRIPAALALAFPIATIATNALSSAALLSSFTGNSASETTRLALFLVVLVISYVLVFKILGQFTVSGSAPMSALLAALAGTAITLVFWVETPSLETLWRFGPQVVAIFGALYRFWWILASYLVLAWTRR